MIMDRNYHRPFSLLFIVKHELMMSYGLQPIKIADKLQKYIFYHLNCRQFNF